MPVLKDVIYEILSKRSAFSTALRFETSSLVTVLNQTTVSSPLTFTVVSGLTPILGSSINVRLIADGVNIPNLSNFKTALNSNDYDNRVGVANDLTFWYNGYDYWVAITQESSSVVIPPSDTSPPVAQSIDIDSVNAAILRVTYNETLLSTSIPPVGSFTVTINPTLSVSVSSVSIAGAVLSVTTSAAVPSGSTVSLGYSPGSTPVKDASGNLAGAFNLAATRVDSIAPTLVSAAFDTLDFTKVILTYNEALNTSSVPAASAFTLTGSTVSSVAIASSLAATLTLASAFPAGNSGTLVYDVPTSGNKIQDVAGNVAAGFTQAISRELAARTWEFKSVSSIPSGFTPSNLVQNASDFTSSGWKMQSNNVDWGTSLLTGPIVNWDRPLVFFLLTTSVTGNNYGAGVSTVPANWLARTPPPNALVCTRNNYYFNSTGEKNFTQAAASTRMKFEMVKEGNDVRCKTYRFSSGSYVLVTNGEYLRVGAVSALGSNPLIFVDAYNQFITIESITN